MRIDSLYIKAFKNLEQITIVFDQTELYTILLGQNATGKSNLLEAIIQIFKYLDLERAHPNRKFDYDIKYELRGNNIHVKNQNTKYEISLNGQIIKTKDFFANKDIYLPKHVFTYYSGISDKLKDNFTEHLKRYYLTIIDPKAIILDITEIRRLFYAENIHSNFVLLAFYSFLEIEAQSKEFLNEILGIEGFHSAMFVLRKPVWSKLKNENFNFWGATGIVKEFLDSLLDLSLAPISNSETVEVSYKSNEKQDRLYLYLSNKEKLQKLAKSWTGRIPFFNALESTYISDLVEDIRVRVKKKNVKKDISYRELSEGEQQLLAVLGLLKFTRDEESLILLDEPDTHLNPLWKWKYLEFLKKVVGNDDHKTQIILTTHDPLVIGSLERNQIRVFSSDKNGKTSVDIPDVDPIGLGVAGILTSELFGLPSILDQPTLDKLNQKRILQVKMKDSGLSDDEMITLKKLEEQLEELGFSRYQRDPLYQKFIEATIRNPELRKPPIDKIGREKQNKIMAELLAEILKEEG
ncbi:AAA family ATPase [Pedobacter frigoris]|uniref:ATPase AAA-type core domain-containing protein n=1 Tax=Pedobacter frigoris TaxID=2571272 RepID=A0A4U1CD43_9SPHI|nr:ATP-binding protein [Pedobacter frigoris]TKC04864.1 hypothetical protein FA047_13905 [Pedobacter frigoris]